MDDDPYTLLGLPLDATDEQIHAAHRRLAREHHPDLRGPSSHTRFAMINAAVDRLRDPEKRKAIILERLIKELRNYRKTNPPKPAYPTPPVPNPFVTIAHTWAKGSDVNAFTAFGVIFGGALLDHAIRNR